MKIPHPGELRHLVEIGRTVNAVNENGYPVETDQTICRVWAAAEDDSSRYFFSADAEMPGAGWPSSSAGARTFGPVCG